MRSLKRVDINVSSVSQHWGWQPYLTNMADRKVTNVTTNHSKKIIPIVCISHGKDLNLRRVLSITLDLTE